MIGNPFKSKRDPSLIVDRLLGESYKIVKAVYCELPALKEIIESDNLQSIVDNFEEIRKILAISEDIKDIGDNLDEILRAQSYANSARNDAELSQKWAIKMEGPVNGIDYSSKFYAYEAMDYARQVREDAEEVKNINSAIAPVARSVRIVANNINSVNTTAGNISDVNIVAADLEGEMYSFTDLDLGNVDDPESPNTSITGGYIVNVANNIDSINTVANNVDLIKSIAESIGKFTGEVNKAYAVLEQVNLLYQQTQQARDEAKLAATETKQESIRLVDTANKQIVLITKEGIKQRDILNETAKDLIDKIQDSSIDKIDEVTADSIKELQIEGSNQISKIIMTGKSVIDDIDDQVNLSKTYAEAAKVSEENAKVSETSASTSATEAEQSNISAQASKEAAKTSETNAKASETKAIEQANLAATKANEASTSATNSANSAELAKKWATQETDPVEDSLYSAKYYADQAKVTLTEVNSAGQTQVDRIVETGSTQVGLVTAEGTKQIQAIKDQQALSVQAVKDQQTASTQAVIDEGTKQINLAKAEVTKATEQATIATNKATEATEQAAEATKQAEIAKEAAEHATANQLQADWNQTDPVQKDFIKNKPDVYTKAQINETFATKVELGTKADANHTHTIDQITNLQTTLNAKLDTSVAQSTYATIEQVATDLETKAPLSHTHTIENITGLKAELDNKLGLTAKAESAKVADSVAWINVIGTEKVRTTDTLITVNDLAEEIDLGNVGI